MMSAWDMLLEAAWRGGLVVAVAGLAALACRRRSAELRHAIWLAALVGLLVVPVALLALPRWPLPLLPAGEVAHVAPGATWQVEGGVTRAEPGDIGRTGPSRRRGAGEFLVWVWLAGAGLFAARTIRSHLVLATLIRAARPLHDRALERELRNAASAIGIAAPVCLRTAGIGVPLAAGSIRPVVLLPESASAWSASHRRSVLLHELSHLRRRDPLWLALAQAVRALYWFHPPAWLAVRELRRESERACDDAVLRAGERPSHYAETLLAMATSAADPAPAAGVAFLRRSGLEARIVAILSAGSGRRRLGRRESLAVAAVAILATLPLALAQPVPAAPSRSPGAPAPTTVRATEHGTSSAAPRSGRTAAWLDRAARTSPTPARFRNPARGVVEILTADVRVVPRVEGRREGVALPSLRLANRDRTRGVSALRLALDLPTTRDRMWVETAIAPGDEAELRVSPSQWSAVVPVGDARQLEVSLVAATFDDGSSWDSGKPEPSVPEAVGAPSPRVGAESPATGAKKGATPRARSEPRASAPSQGPTRAARFRNPPDAPVVIVEALTPLAPTPREDRPTTWLPRVRVENRTDLRVVAMRVRYKADRRSHAVSGFQVSIEPRGTATLRKDDFPVWGRPDDVTVQLLGVRFEDGSVWGTMDSTIDARDPWVYPLGADGAR